MVRRRGIRRSRTGDESEPVPVAVFDGSLRNLYDTAGLDVTLSIYRDQASGDRISVVSDDGQLGVWPIGAVGIKPFDSTSYEFHAEGDLLLFTPSDWVGFRSSPFVVGLPPEMKTRKRRRSKNKRARTEPKNVKAPTKKQRRADTSGPVRTEPAAADVSGGLPEDEPARLEGTAGAKEATPGPGDGRDSTSVDLEATTGEVDAVAEAEIEPSLMPSGDVPEPSRTDPGSDQEPAAAVPARIGIARRLWIGVLDKARRYDVLDLDRVPTDKRLRGFEHQHTWDHRVARREGFASHVCTICGGIRLSTPSTKHRR